MMRHMPGIIRAPRYSTRTKPDGTTREVACFGRGRNRVEIDFERPIGQRIEICPDAGFKLDPHRLFNAAAARSLATCMHAAADWSDYIDYLRKSEKWEKGDEAMSDENKIEIPTPGRIVHYGIVEDGKLKGSRALPIVPAGVSEVVEASEGSVFLDIWGQDAPHRFTHCDHASRTPDGEMGWDWMPYQKGQAKKLEQVQAIEFPGLRTKPTNEVLYNRFTYHAPTPEQVNDYAEIRDMAREMAMCMVDRCPPSPELASALDHLDTVVFKANAAIARHTPPSQEPTP